MIDAEKPKSHADPKQVFKLYDAGIFPSQIAVDLNISVNEVLDTLEKRRRDSIPEIKVSK